MTREELLEGMRQLATELNIRQVEARTLLDWVAEGLIEGPQSKGLGRGRGVGRNWAAAKEPSADILRLKAAGVGRADALAIHLWIMGHPVSFARARAGFLAEYERLVRRMRRQVPDVQDQSQPLKILKTYGPLDPSFQQAGIRPTAEIMNLALLCTIWAEHQGLGNILGVTGLFGFPDESTDASLALFKDATVAQFGMAKEGLKTSLSILVLGHALFSVFNSNNLANSFLKAAYNVAVGDFMVIEFARNLNANMRCQNDSAFANTE